MLKACPRFGERHRKRLVVRVPAVVMDMAVDLLGAVTRMPDGSEQTRRPMQQIRDMLHREGL